MTQSNSLLKHRHLLLARLISDLRTNIAGTKLGYLWMIVDPLLLSGVYYFIVVFVFDRGGANYYVFILLGLWPWMFFSRALSQSTASISRNRNLILTVRAPLLVYVLSPILLNGLLSLIGLAITLLFVDNINIETIGIILGLLVVQGLLILGISSFTAVANCFVADTSRLLEYGLRMGFFLTPVLYDQSRITENDNIPQALSVVLALNPMLYIVDGVRSASIQSKDVPITQILIILGISFVLIVLGNIIHRALRNQIVARI